MKKDEIWGDLLTNLYLFIITILVTFPVLTIKPRETNLLCSVEGITSFGQEKINHESVHFCPLEAFMQQAVPWSDLENTKVKNLDLAENKILTLLNENYSKILSKYSFQSCFLPSWVNVRLRTGLYMEAFLQV